ncbi:ABC transporter permease [Acuticoccus sp. M5D2P5]|uniref:ABC transporter permease n=1 Tax=Acuticoccus kalidii TaxID=2910977 RepID=UPI001F19F26A|nr:ABC transporter permease [Acuticoccus kalidii]MCF3934895.1 ABC transporter permease [Acuticoccus kalidii]
MHGYGQYILKRLGQFVLVVFVGISITFFVTHLTPIDPVETTISAAAAFGSTSPEAIAMLRETLRELYGTEGNVIQQYVTFWGRILQGDFGPSLSAFPTPVSELIARALPWTIGLLVTATIIAWVLGNILGGLAGYYRSNVLLKMSGVLAMGLHPIPYYIVAFVLLILFAYVWPIFPLSGGYRMNLAPRWDATFILSVLYHSILPALSLILVGLGSWFMGMRALVSNIVTEDYVQYAELGGVNRRRILSRYVMRNALVPQMTGLAMSLGAIFNGAIITEEVFGYPGIGSLLVDAVHAGDYSLVLGITTISIVSVAAAVLIIDLAYPLLDPRVKVA